MKQTPHPFGFYKKALNSNLKKLISRNFLLTISLFLISFFTINNTYGQSNEDWTLHSELNGVEVFYSFSECGSDEIDLSNPTVINTKENVLVLKFVNKNNNTVNVSWSAQLLNSGATSEFNTSISQASEQITNCENSPKIELSSSANDHKPNSVLNAIELLHIEVTLN